MPGDDDLLEVPSVGNVLTNSETLEEQEAVIESRAATLICDMGYGLPREARPRKEKILAISRQLINFLEWQINNHSTTSSKANGSSQLAQVQIVGCPDEATQSALRDRMQGIWGKDSFPAHVSISCESLQDTCATRNDCSTDDIVYLSPDAAEALEGCPPKVVIVGLLIDRRVQPNRSKHRAMDLEITTRRWPLDECFVDINPNEPLNVDCVLEGMQQWWWNVDEQNCDDDSQYREAFVQAAAQAIQHHAKRHPARPVHLSDKK